MIFTFSYYAQKLYEMGFTIYWEKVELLHVWIYIVGLTCNKTMQNGHLKLAWPEYRGLVPRPQGKFSGVNGRAV